MKGAEQRARAALAADPTLDYGTRILLSLGAANTVVCAAIGIEGGVEQIGDRWVEGACIVVLSASVRHIHIYIILCAFYLFFTSFYCIFLHFSPYFLLFNPFLCLPGRKGHRHERPVRTPRQSHRAAAGRPRARRRRGRTLWRPRRAQQGRRNGYVSFKRVKTAFKCDL